MQVVVRNGALLEATPPDYRELDYIPSELRYALPRTLTPEPSMPASSLSSTLSAPLSSVPSGPFSSFSQEQFRQVSLRANVSVPHGRALAAYLDA